MSNLLIEAYQNKSISRSIQYTVNSVPVDISGWSVLFMAKRSMFDVDSNCVLSSDLTSTIGLSGQCSLNLSAEDLNLAAGCYHCDIQAFPPANGEPLIVEGKLIVGSVVNQEA